MAKVRTVEDNRLVKLAEAAQKMAGGMMFGGMMFDGFVASAARLAEANKRAYSCYQNFNMMAALQKYATILDKPVQDLTEDEKRQAFLNHILEKSDRV